MLCQICNSNEAIAKCILCEKELCESCTKACSLKDKDICIQKAGEFIIYQCPATYCPSCGFEALIFTCKSCGIKFCKSVIDNWSKACPTCKDYICGYCYEEHIRDCEDYYDMEDALDKLYKLVEGDKPKNP